jgi:hypothetical protein
VSVVQLGTGRRSDRTPGLSVKHPAYGRGVNSLIIDCDQCAHQHTTTCDDCVVSFICSSEPSETVVVDATERLALRRLSAAGLVPELRHAPRSG